MEMGEGACCAVLEEVPDGESERRLSVARGTFLKHRAQVPKKVFNLENRLH